MSSLKGGTDTCRGLGVWRCKAYALYGIRGQMRSHTGGLCDVILSPVVNARKTDNRRQVNYLNALPVSVERNRAKTHEL